MERAAAAFVSRGARKCDPPSRVPQSGTIPPKAAAQAAGGSGATVVVTVAVAAADVEELTALTERFGTLVVSRESAELPTCGHPTLRGPPCRRRVARAGLRCFQHRESGVVAVVPVTPGREAPASRAESPVSVSSQSSVSSVGSDWSLQGLPIDEARLWRSEGRPRR